jgi:hypothetical protein
MPEPGYHAPHAPPCARYEGGENDNRLLAVWTYVAGLLGGEAAARKLSEDVARLYDYKGQLVVACRRTLAEAAQSSFRIAWVEVGCELSDNVEFCDVQSADWEKYWRNRRFESDWTP